MRVFIGGVTQPEQLEHDDVLRDRPRSSTGARRLDRSLGRADFHADHAASAGNAPGHNLGHLDRVSAIRRNLAKYSRLYLTGIAYDGVGIPDCIHAAQDTADSLIDALAKQTASAA